MRRILNFLEKLPIAAILLILAGLAMVICPETAVSVIIRTIGIIAILYAVLRICELFAEQVRTFFTPFSFLLTIALLACGIVLTVSPNESTRFFILMAGIYLVFDGLISLYRLHMARLGMAVAGAMPGHGSAYYVALALSIASVAFGIVMIVLPAASFRIVSLLIGIALLYAGIRALLLWVRGRRLLKDAEAAAAKSSYIETDFVDKSDQ